MKLKNQNRLVSSIMVCATVLGLASTNGSVLAQDTANNSKPATSSKQQAPAQTGNTKIKLSSASTTNSSKASASTSSSAKASSTNSTSSKASSSTSNNRASAKSSNSNRSKSSSDNHTGNINLMYQYNGSTKASIDTKAKVGSTVDFQENLPKGLQSKYHVGANNSYKVRTPNSTAVPVSLEAVKHASKASQASSDSSKASSASQSSASSASSQAPSSTVAKQFSSETNSNVFAKKSQPKKQYKDTTTPVKKQDSTPLPSVQYTQQRHHVVNPMFRPDSAPQIQSSSQYDSQVPMNSSDEPTRDLKDVKPFKDFTKEVLRYKPYMDKVCAHYHMKDHETLMLAIMQVESGGRGKDVMQSSESVGLKAGSLDPQQSIEQGVRYMSKIVDKAHAMDKAEHANKNMNPKDYHYYANDNRLLAQTYNYGGNFLDYVSKQKNGYNTNVAQKYSKDVVAPRLGNKSGSTYTYDNPISKMYHKTYLYTNGGNFFYGDMVEQYAVNGYMHTILEHLIKYAGQKYVFGGKNPRQGFDCSGLTSYGFRLLHVMLPSYTVTQWHDTKPVKGGLNNSKPGDLIFFKGTYGGPNFISHVGFIVDPHTMFAADSDGVGFHNIDETYWKQHFAGVRRIPQAHKLNVQASHQLDDKVKAAVQAFK